MHQTTRIPLTLGPLAAEGYVVQRSGIRWLCDDGHLCRPGEAIAYCNLGLDPGLNTPRNNGPFEEESDDFQVVLAPRVEGRLVRDRAVSRGGFFDRQHWQRVWSEETRIGELECASGSLADVAPEQAGRLRLLLLAGRRFVAQADVPAGLLTGWHERTRGWWWRADEGEVFRTVSSLGICEQAGIVRGEHFAFLELFEAVAGPAHVVFTPDNILVPASPTLCSWIGRTPEQRERIIENVASTFGQGTAQSKSGLPATNDWLFAGCVLKSLARCPLLEQYDLLTASGLKTTGPPDGVILSLNSETAPLLRHRQLGYFLSLHQFRRRELGPVASAWLNQEFDVIRRSPQDVKRDLLELIDLVQSTTKAHLLILNGMSSNRNDQCFCFAPFDKPLSATLEQIRAQELNLVLYEIAHERDVSIIDVDAIGVELGGKHIADGVHASGELQQAIRNQIVTILRERDLVGFR
jgi:hypothetical protein